MKKSIYNLEVVSDAMIFEMYRKKFGHIGAVTLMTYDLGDNVTKSYTQVEIAPNIKAVLHDDINEIALKANGIDLFSVMWNAETEDLLHKFNAIPHYQAFAELAQYGVEK